jgi:hypothetical protein
MEKTCPCDKKFYCIPALVERKKYCSKKCFYQYRVVPIWNKGLKGIHLSPKSEFKKGQKAWNKGVHLGNRIPHWKGDRVGYEALHEWVERWGGKKRACELCGTTKAKKYDWSNKSGEYKRDLSDWQRICVKCHFNYDKEKFGTRKDFHR